MRDIVELLRNEVAWEQDVGELLESAAKEIEWLRQNRNHWMRTAHAFDEHLATMRVALMEQPGVRFGAAESRETVQCPYVTGRTTKYCTLPTTSLTPEERESLTRAVTEMCRVAREYGIEADANRARALRGLLERLGGER